MTRTLAALNLLRGESANLQKDPIRLRIDPNRECAGLLATLSAMRHAVFNVLVPHPPLDPAQVWNFWKKSGFDFSALDSRQMRTLCTSEETALKPALMAALEQHPEVLRRSICFYGIAVAYFSKWRTMTSPELIERILKQCLERTEKPGSVVALWRQHANLFSTEAANCLASEVMTRKCGLAEVLAEKLVPLTSALSLAAAARVAELAAFTFRQNEDTLSENQKLDELKWITSSAWLTPVPTESFYCSASQLILSKTAERSDYFRKGLTEHIRFDNRLGDPRLSYNNPKWRGMEAQAAHRFLSWLARDSIQFFFNTILPDNNHNRRRKDFWLAYHGAIRDFQVAVSEQDLWRLKRTSSIPELPLFSKVNHTTTSAFLSEFPARLREG